MFESAQDQLDRIKSYSPVKERELAPYASTQSVFDSPTRGGAAKAMALDGFELDDDFKVEPFDQSSSSPRKRGRDSTPENDAMAVDDDDGTDVEDVEASPTRRSARSHQGSNRSLGRAQTAPQLNSLAFDEQF